MANGNWKVTSPSFKELRTRGDAATAESCELVAQLHELLDETHRLRKRLETQDIYTEQAVPKR